MTGTPWSPRAILDAGGESGALLCASLYRCIEEILPGQVMQVISRVLHGRVEVPEWCSMAGHELLGTQEEGNETVFWIRRCA